VSLVMRLPGEVWCPSCGAGPYTLAIDNTKNPGQQGELPSMGEVIYLGCCDCFVEVVEDGLKLLPREEGARRGLEQLRAGLMK
jgi:hypothetical protein